MKIGLDEIKTSEYGMPASHMEAICESAKEIGPIGIRPVSKFAEDYIVAGHPTKPFNIKTKTIKEGPAAGLLAVDPAYGRPIKLSAEQSKLTPEEQNKLVKKEEKKYESSIQNAYDKDILKNTKKALKQIDLKITNERLEKLQSLDESIRVTELKNSEYKYKITWGDPAKPMLAFAKENADKTLGIFDKDDQPIKVLGRLTRKGEKGVTADYDVLVNCPPYASLDPAGIDKTPFRTQGASESDAIKNKSEISKSLESPPETRSRNESETGGNWSKRTKSAVAKINETIKAFDPENRTGIGLEVAHHNSEFTNPFADAIINNVPCFFALPKKMDLSAILDATHQPQTENARSASMVLIETPEEMNALRNILRDQGYYWPSHASYADTIQPFRSEAVQAMEGFIAQRLQVLEEKSTATILRDLPAEDKFNKVEDEAPDNFMRVINNNTITMEQLEAEEQKEDVSNTPIRPSH